MQLQGSPRAACCESVSPSSTTTTSTLSVVVATRFSATFAAARTVLAIAARRYSALSACMTRPLRRAGRQSTSVVLGLIVLQRAALAVDDLAVLLHALALDDPEAAANPASDAGAEIWTRMVSMTIPDDITLFRTIAEARIRRFVRFACRPTRASRESLPPAAEAAARRLRDRTARRWGLMLVRVAQFWLTYGVAAKATIPRVRRLLAGRQFTEPPGAGVLGKHVRPPDDPFVVMVNSDVEGTNVRTPQLVLAMPLHRVRDFRRHGSTAVKFAAELCATLAEGIDNGYGYGIPPLLAGRLSEADRDALARAWGDEAGEQRVASAGPDPEAAWRRRRARTSGRCSSRPSPRGQMALADAIDHFDEARKAEARGWADMAFLGIMAEALQALEDLAYVGESFTVRRFNGLPFYIGAITYSPLESRQRLYTRKRTHRGLADPRWLRGTRP